MATTAHLVSALKRELKSKDITYLDVAGAIGLSEASVKRMFAKKQFTLDRISAICALVGWDWIDLVAAAREGQEKLDHLTQDQEEEIAKDIELLMVAVSIINGFSYQDLLEQYRLTEAQCIQKLAKLDRLKLIELLPGNRIKLLISNNFRWNPNGPIQRFFLEVVVQDFFNTRFAEDDEKLVVLNAVLSEGANQNIQQKMEKLTDEMSAIMKSEANLPMNTKKGNTLILALRRWRFKPFEERTRKL